MLVNFDSFFVLVFPTFQQCVIVVSTMHSLLKLPILNHCLAYHASLQSHFALYLISSNKSSLRYSVLVCTDGPVFENFTRCNTSVLGMKGCGPDSKLRGQEQNMARATSSLLQTWPLQFKFILHLIYTNGHHRIISSLLDIAFNMSPPPSQAAAGLEIWFPEAVHQGPRGELTLKTIKIKDMEMKEKAFRDQR